MIKLQNVSKSFKGNIAIKNLNLEVKKGEIFGLLGANGAGKSTTINMLLGFLNSDSGSVYINDLDTSNNSQEARKLIGYIPENVNLYPYLSGLENLDYDEIQPNEDWVTDNVEGSSKTGNNPEWANTGESDVNKKRNKIRKDNMLAKIKRKAYNKAPQPIVTDHEGNDKADSIMTKLESIDEKKKQKINEDYTRIMDLMSYKKNTQ